MVMAKKAFGPAFYWQHEGVLHACHAGSTDCGPYIGSYRGRGRTWFYSICCHISGDRSGKEWPEKSRAACLRALMHAFRRLSEADIAALAAGPIGKAPSVLPGPADPSLGLGGGK
jgi:hypothetical protein